MLLDWKSFGNGGRRATPAILLTLLASAVLVTPIQGSGASAPVSGVTHLGNTSNYGTTAYSIDYSYPATVEVGTNLTISLSLHVDSLGGVIEYITDYRLNAYVYIGDQLVGNGSEVSALDAPFLYPGGTWGPHNVTIPLTASGTGIHEGQSANASVVLTLVNQDHIANGQLSFYTTEPAMQGHVGTFLIQYGGSSTSTGSSTISRLPSPTYLPEALVAAGIVLILLAAAIWPRSRSRL